MKHKESPAKEKRAARSKRRRNQTRTEILNTARDVILRDGLGAFSLSSVADELGLTKPALYYYFNSKEALVFELWFREWTDAAAQVQAVVQKAKTGMDAVESLMRAVFERYHNHLDLFMLVHTAPRAVDVKQGWGPSQIEAIHPVNELLYGRAEARLRADQRKGLFPKDRDPRRFVFTAHLAVIGLLNMKAMVEAASDPLIHRDQDLIDDICRTFREAAQKGGSI